MKTYSHYGITDFIICAGYKAHMISEWFANYRLRTADVTFDFSDHSVNYHDDSAEKWKVGVVHTGEDTMTGGRLRRVREYIGTKPRYGGSRRCLPFGLPPNVLRCDKKSSWHGPSPDT